MNANMILPILVFYPFAGALLSGMIGAKWEKARDLFAGFVVISEFLLVLAVFIMNRGDGEAAILFSSYMPGICSFTIK